MANAAIMWSFREGLAMCEFVCTFIWSIMKYKFASFRYKANFAIVKFSFFLSLY